MSYKPYVPSKKEQDIWKQGLSDCDAIAQDLERAKDAGVPNIEALEEALQVCRDRIEKLRKIYSPRSK